MSYIDAMKRIIEIAEIHSGYPFRKAINHEANGDLAVIQMSDLQNHTKLNYGKLVTVKGIQPKPHHFVKPGDLLFIAKGAHNFATHIDRHVERAIVTANFLIIRVTAPDVMPEYLAWYINQSPAQTFLKENAKGSSIPAISKAALSKLHVPIPSLKLQQQIVRTQQLLELENHLQSRIQNSRRKIIEAQLLKTASGGEKNAQL